MKRAARFLPALAALSFMGACATAPDAEADTRAWVLGADGAETRLAYGTPDSDDAPLMLRCRAGSGRVTVSRDAAKPGEGVTLASGGRSLTLRGQEEPDMINGEGVIVTAQTSLNGPVLQGFRDSGRLALVTDRRRAELPATAAERVQIRRFFQTCGAA